MTNLQGAFLLINLVANSLCAYYTKLWAVTNQHIWIIIAGIFTLCSFALMAFQIKQVGLASVGTYVLVLTVVCNVLLGVVLFNEKINSMQYFGILLAFLGVLLVLFFPNQST